MRTPTQVAHDTLDAHAIKPDWQRSGEQIIPLIAEAVEADRAQRKIANWDEAGQLVQAYREAEDGWSADAEHEAAQEVVGWVEATLESGNR